MGAFDSGAFFGGGFYVGSLPPPVPVVVGGGDYAESHRKASKRRAEDLAREKDEKQRLRELIAETIEPTAREAEPVAVVAQGDEVQVVSASGRSVTIDVPGLMKLGEVARMVSQALERAEVQFLRFAAEQEAQAYLQKEAARIAKRRRDDELLMLMD
jgi:FKBP-type peptidyl-prolyl cis-trans isomerase (trigger factor)